MLTKDNGIAPRNSFIPTRRDCTCCIGTKRRSVWPPRSAPLTWEQQQRRRRRGHPSLPQRSRSSSSSSTSQPVPRRLRLPSPPAAAARRGRNQTLASPPRASGVERASLAKGRGRAGPGRGQKKSKNACNAATFILVSDTREVYHHSDSDSY